MQPSAYRFDNLSKDELAYIEQKKTRSSYIIGTYANCDPNAKLNPTKISNQQKRRDYDNFKINYSEIVGLYRDKNLSTNETLDSRYLTVSDIIKESKNFSSIRY